MRFSDKCLAPPPQVKKKTKLKDEQNEGHKMKTKQKENRKKKLYCKEKCQNSLVLSLPITMSPHQCHILLFVFSNKDPNLTLL